MLMLKQIRLSGFGGQGVILAGTLLGHSAIAEGKWVAGSNAYGVQARGGNATSEVVISNQKISFPHIISTDLLIAFSQGAYDCYKSDLEKERTMVVYDTLLVKTDHKQKVVQVGIQATALALQHFDNKQAANIILLAAAAALAGVVGKETLGKSIHDQISKDFIELNLKALTLGYSLGEKIKSDGVVKSSDILR